MRLTCHYREIRAFEKKGVREMAEVAGINRGTLSLIESGRLLPLDEQVPGIELAYGRPIERIYSALALRAAQEDEAPE